MIFSKKVNFIVYGLALIFFVVGIICIVRINILYPNAKVVDNSETGYVRWLGCRIEADNVKIYSPQEYAEAFPEYAHYYDYLLEEKNRDQKGGIVVYTIDVTNENDGMVDFRTHVQAYGCSEPSMWCNGLAPLTTDSVIEPGETKKIIVASSYQASLVNGKYIDRMREEEYQLIFSDYPERILLRFEK